MSKIINFETMQIIVEKSLRDNGFGGKILIADINGQTQQVDMDEGWKDSLPGPGGNPFNNPQNMQKLRDAIAQSITQALAASSASGSITQGNTIQTNQVVTEVPGSIILNGDASSKGAARINDSVFVSLLSDPLFFSWMTTVSTLNQSQAGTAAGLLASIQAVGGVQGKITTGSSSVKIGD